MKTTKDQAALDKIGAFLTGGKARKVYFSRQFYSGTKSIRITQRTAPNALRINAKTGKLQIWEGKSSGGWCDVLGHYRVTGE